MSALHKEYPVTTSSSGRSFSVATPYTPKRYALAATSLVFAGPGGVHTLVIGVGAVGGIVELFDDVDTSAPSNQKFKITATTPMSLLLDFSVETGLVIKLTNAPDVTIMVL